MSTDHELLPTFDLAELEKLAIVGALAKHGGNRTQAARTLGVSVRTLQRRVARLGLPDVATYGARADGGRVKGRCDG